MSINFPVRLTQCGRIINETPRLNDLLHNAEFVVNKMKQIFTIFEEPSLALTLNMLSTILQDDANVMDIVKNECGDTVIRDDVLFPFLIMYCSFIVYTEYIKIQKHQT